MAPAKEPIIGIDLGTTNSEVTCLDDGQARILKLDGDDGIVPSCVAVDSKGNLLVGREAKNQILVNPRNTVCSVKRKMGSNEKIRLGKENYTPQEISAFILKSLKQRAEKVLGQLVGKAVITVPAYFTDAQRYATREAGEIAGLEVVRIINEPTAAALAYGATHEENQRILVFDLGGGTFDVSIVTIEDGVVEVMASTGNNQLGGDDFDDKIVELLVHHLKTEKGFSPKDEKVLRARLKRAAEAAKIELSDNPYAMIQEDHLGRVHGKPVHLEYELSRDEFEALVRENLVETMEAVTRAMRDASLLPGAISKVLLVGGSTRIPMVAEMLEEKLGKVPHSEVDPDLCVALGAGIQAGVEMGRDVGSVLVDVTPYTFGTSVLDPIAEFDNGLRFVPLIKRNSKLPVSKSDVFYTTHDSQDKVIIEVYQGEDPDVRKDILIGQFHFGGLSAVPAGNEIILNFRLDVNGLLKIHAVEKRTGREIRGVVENAMRRFEQDEIDRSRRRIESLWGEEEPLPDAADRNWKPVVVGGTDFSGEQPETERAEAGAGEIRRTLERARNLLEHASEEDQQDMVNLIEDITDALDRDDLENAEALREELEDLLFYVED